MDNLAGNAEMKNTLRMVKHLIPHQDIALIILKGHLLIEELLFDQVASAMRNVSELKLSRLSFDRLVHLTKALFGFSNDQRLWQAVEKLNMLRNELIHHLEPTKFQKLAKAFLRPSEKMMGQIAPTSESLESRLRDTLAYLYGALSNISKIGRRNEAGKAGSSPAFPIKATP